MSNKNTAVPAYLVLVAAILEKCEELGIEPVRSAAPSTLPENKGYVFVRFGSDDAAAVIIPKSTGTVKLCDVHVDMSDLACWVPLAKANGRVLGRIDASTADWAEVLTRLFGASKRPIKRASQAASGGTVDMTAFVAKLKTLGMPKVEAQAAAAEYIDGRAEELADIAEEFETPAS
jgi:hypothetical protein